MNLSEVVVESRSLKKSFAEKVILRGLDLKIYRGECFALLGPDGAGKSTALKMMYCASPMDSGELFIAGLNAKNHFRQIKEKIGVLPQENNLDSDFTVIDNLIIFAGYHGIDKKEADERARNLLRRMGLEDKINFSVEELNNGERRRLAMARALMNDPDIVFLDEPTWGLDPKSQKQIWKIIDQLKKRGLTIILTTHFMEEAEELSTRVAIIDQGEVLCEGMPKELIQEKVGNEVVEFFCRRTELDYYLSRLKDRYDYQVINDQVRLFIRSDQEGKRVIDQIFSESMTIRRSTLDDVFLKTAGYELRPRL